MIVVREGSPVKKMLWIVILLLSLITTDITPVIARDRHWDRDGESRLETDSFSDRVRARQILRQTAEILQRAQRAAERGGQFQSLGKAVAHHRRSRRLFRADFYPEAVFHSKRARKLAFDVLQNNRAMSREDWRVMRDDDGDRDFDFDVWILRESQDDKAALRFYIEID